MVRRWLSSSHHWARWRFLAFRYDVRYTKCIIWRKVSKIGSRNLKQNLDIWKRIDRGNLVLLFLQFYRWQIHQISPQNERLPLNLVVDGIDLSFVETESWKRRLCHVRPWNYYILSYSSRSAVNFTELLSSYQNSGRNRSNYENSARLQKDRACNVFMKRSVSMHAL